MSARQAEADLLGMSVRDHLDDLVQLKRDALVLAQGGIAPKEIAAALDLHTDLVESWLLESEVHGAESHMIARAENLPATEGTPRRAQKKQRKTTKRSIPKSVRWKIVELRLQGITSRRISKLLEVDVTDVQLTLEATFLDHSLLDKPGILNQLRQMELDRLDSLQSAFWSRACDGEKEAFDCVMKVIKRRAEMLGLDAPRWTASKAITTTAAAKQVTVEQLERTLANMDDAKFDRLIRAADAQARLVDSGGELQAPRAAQGVAGRGLETADTNARATPTQLSLQESVPDLAVSVTETLTCTGRGEQ